MKNLLNDFKVFLRPSGRFFSALFGLLCLLVFSSCSKNDKNTVSDNANKYVLHKNNQSLSEEIQLKQAKYFDLPIPVGYNFVEFTNSQTDLSQQSVTKQSDFFCYVGDFQLKRVRDFYRLSMERSGWDVADLSTPHEGLLFCNKSNRECAVSIRDDNDICRVFFRKSCVYIFIKNKSSFSKDSEIKDLNFKNISDV
jgi:hypothetical protein